MPFKRPTWALRRNDTDIVPAQELHDVNSSSARVSQSKDPVIEEAKDVESLPKPIEALPSEDAQAGVAVAEAITASWTRTTLTMVYICFWSAYCVNAFQSSITSNLTPFVTSSFELHSLTSTISVVANIMSGCFYPIVARVLNIWGRWQGFAVMATIATLGLIMMAVCRNITTYAAAEVFYSVGFTGMIYSVDVLTADTSTLRSRGLAYAFTASPWIITAFAGPKASESFYEQISWRWGFGVFCIILPFVALPLVVILMRSERKARQRGLLVKQRSGRMLMQNIWFYLVEFDVLGVFILAAGLSLFLLPFSLADRAPDGWKSGYIIAMLVLGVVLLISAYFVERYLAPKPFIPYHLLVNRTLLGTCLLTATWQIAYYCWDSYFTSYLQVVYRTSVAQAGYIGSSYDVVSGVWCIIVGLAIQRTGRFKWLYWFAVPLYILAQGLMIYFRRPGRSVGYIVMCQCFIAIAGGTFTMAEQVSALAVANHKDVAAVLALLGLFGYMGGAVGNAVSGAIWTNTMPKQLAKRLPASALKDLDAIYESLDTQLSYAWGTPVREAIIGAYAMAQTRMLIAGTAVMAFTLVWVVMIKNISVKNSDQVKGVLF